MVGAGPMAGMLRKKKASVLEVAGFDLSRFAPLLVREPFAVT